MGDKDVHIVPHEGKWAIKRPNTKKVSKKFKTKKEAEDAGRKQAKKDKSELVIHKKNGKISDKDSFGNDPNPPKDKKH